MAGELSPVGWTALMVAQARAAETRRPDRVCADGWARHFVAASAQPVPEPDEHAAAASARAWESLVDYQAVRTRYLDDYCREATARSGCRQVVLLAAGLDTRAVRLNWPEGTTVFELDRDEVLQFKQQMLQQHGDLPAATATRRTVAVDLAQDWPATLLQAGFDPSMPTAWLAEGLLPFLDPTTCDQLLDGITRLSAPGSRLGLEWFDPALADAPAQQELTALLGMSLGELWAGGPDQELLAWLASSGWAVSTADPAERALAHHRPVPMMLDPAAGGVTRGQMLLSAATPADT